MQYRGAIINTHQDYSFSIHFCLQILFVGEVVDIYGVKLSCYPATLGVKGVFPAIWFAWAAKHEVPSKNIQTNASGITMMCHGFVRSLILVLLCLETVSFGIISNTDGYVFISGKSQTAFPGKKIKCNSRVHDFMFDNFGLGGVLRWPRRVTHAN